MITINDERLLPCPFCGEDATIGYFPAEERLGAKDAYYVGCSNDNCGCELEHTGGYKTLEEALEKWNRRADIRDCKNCKHYVMKVEIGKGSSHEKYWGCESWNCKFEPKADRSKEDGKID